nr:MAG TPA: hypothetical protein [Caudoviricetes sp.]
MGQTFRGKYKALPLVLLYLHVWSSDFVSRYPHQYQSLSAICRAHCHFGSAFGLCTRYNSRFAILRTVSVGNYSPSETSVCRNRRILFMYNFQDTFIVDFIARFKRHIVCYALDINSSF